LAQVLSGSFLGWASTIDRDAVTERGIEVGCGEVILPLRLKPERLCDTDRVPGIGPMHGRRIEVGAEVRLEGGKALVTKHRLERGRPVAEVGHPGENGRAHPGRRGGAGHQESSTGGDYSGIRGWDMPTEPFTIFYRAERSGPISGDGACGCISPSRASRNVVRNACLSPAMLRALSVYIRDLRLSSFSRT